MKKLIDETSVPPCGWTYTVPLSGYEAKGACFLDLCHDVSKNLALNNAEMAPAKIREVVMDDVCSRCPTGICEGVVNNLFVRSRAVMNGTIALAMMIKRGVGAFVSRDVANSRAAICVECEYNIENPGCSTCKGFGVIIRSVKRGRTTNYDGDLKTCGVCRCFIEALVHVDAAIIDRTTSRKSYRYYPDHCWKMKLLKSKEK